MRSLGIFAFAALLGLRAAPAPQVVAVGIDGIIHPVTVEILSRAFDEARQRGAQLVILRLNTPGGLLTATRDAVEKILAAPVPVAGYVTPSGGRAASAGFFLLQACDIAVMAPGTNTGAAHPVAIGVEMDPVMKQKVENDAAASLRSIAGKRGRNAALAEKAVLESKSFTDKEALENKLIEAVAGDEQNLLAQLDGREVTRFDGRRQTLHLKGAVVETYERSLRQKIMATLADPNIAMIFLVLGALGIYVEFSTPGLIFPGVAGAILALLGLSAMSVLPINGLGAALLILAVALFILEAKFASHGILGVGGTVAMILGAMLLIDSPMPEMRIRFATAAALAIPFAAITIFLVSLVVRARRNKVVTGSAGMLGEEGIVVAPLGPEGKVFVHGEYWDAVADSALPEGARVRVTGVDKLKLTVEPVSNGGSRA